MKKFFLFILLLLVIGGLYAFKNNSESDKSNNNQISDQNNFQPDPSSAIFTFDDGKVTLSGGKSEEVDETGMVSETLLLEERASGDLNADGKEDTVLLLARSGGGSGVFIYVAAYVSGPINYKGTDALYIGDRVAPQSITIKNGIATVNYLDRHPDEALASEPTVPTYKQFVYKNGEFVER